MGRVENGKGFGWLPWEMIGSCKIQIKGLLNINQGLAKVKLYYELMPQNGKTSSATREICEIRNRSRKVNDLGNGKLRIEKSCTMRTFRALPRALDIWKKKSDYLNHTFSGHSFPFKHMK